ncbi:unnamed protein product [marine sediment metagenome]|uniref:Uncharacterized protein n=1 Tax=marine sediment metagenome TaxID=412755 RepID=X1C2D6_9ZZZZ
MDYKDWEKLDDLLNKEGYGGYYDLLELLKSYIRHWYEDKFGMVDIETLERNIQKIKTLHQATCMLSAIELREKRGK